MLTMGGEQKSTASGILSQCQGRSRATYVTELRSLPGRPLVLLSFPSQAIGFANFRRGVDL